MAVDTNDRVIDDPGCNEIGRDPQLDFDLFYSYGALHRSNRAIEDMYGGKR